jgi:hypothetical protein
MQRSATVLENCQVRNNTGDGLLATNFSWGPGVKGCTFEGNGLAGFAVSSSSSVVTGCKFIANAGQYAVSASENAQLSLGDVTNASPDDDGGNYFLCTAQYALGNLTGSAVMAQNNYWSTWDAASIPELIVDQDDNPSYGHVTYTPCLGAGEYPFWQHGIEANGPWPFALDYQAALGGELFSGNVSAVLVDAAGHQLQGAGILVDQGGRTLLGRVNFAGAIPGWYDMTITNGTGTAKTLTQAVQVLVQQIPVPTSVSPNKVPNITAQVLHVTGRHINPFAMVKVTRAGQPDICGVMAQVGRRDGTEVVAQCDLTGHPAGLYDVQVTNGDGGSASLGRALNVWVPLAELFLDAAPTNGELSSASQVDRYVVNLPAGKRVFVHLTKPAGDWPSQLGVSLERDPGLTAQPACGDQLVKISPTRAGTYYIAVAGSSTGRYRLEVTETQPSVALALDTPADARVDAGGTMVYALQVDKAGELFVTLQKVETAWDSTLVVKQGTTVLATQSGSSDLLLQTDIASPGQYTLEITASGSAGTGVLRAGTSLPAVTLSRLFVGTIRHNDGCDWSEMDVPAGLSVLSFTAETVGNISNLDVWRGSFSSTEHWSASQSFNPPIRLTIANPPAGKYYLRVTDHGVLTGSQVRDYSVLVVGTPAVQPVEPSVVEANGPWNITVRATGALGTQPFAADSTMALTGPAGQQITGQEVAVAADALSLSARLDFLGAAPGAYDLQVVSGANTRALSAAVQVVASQAPAISAITPATGSNTGTSSVTVSGKHLNPFATVRLSRTGEPDIVAAPVAGSTDGTALTATFNLGGRTPGSWVLAVTNPDGAGVASGGGFQVIANGSAHVWVTATGPSVARTGRETTYVVQCGNDGTTDAYEVVVCVRLPAGVVARIEAPLMAAGEPAPPVHELDGKAIRAVFIQRLAAGSAVSFPVILAPPSGASDPLPLEVGLFRTTDALYCPDGGNVSASGAPRPAVALSAQGAKGDWGEGFIVYIGPGWGNPEGHDAVATFDTNVGRAVWDQWMAYEARRHPEKWPAACAQRTGPVPYDVWLAQATKEGGAYKGARPLPGYTAASGASFVSRYKAIVANVETIAPYRIIPGGGYENCASTIGRAWYEATGLYIPDLTPGAQWVFSYGTFEDFYHGFSPPEILWDFVAGRSGYTAYLRELIDLAQVLPYVMIRPVSASDPNDKSGPPGYGDSRFVSCRAPLSYVVEFENDPKKATAAAAEVDVTDQLDPSLDWRTYRITGLQIGEESVPVPDGAQTLSTALTTVVKLKDLNDPNYPNCAPVDRTVRIEVTSEFSPVSGRVRWYFVGRDPATGELADFLPPNVAEDDPGTPWNDLVAPQGQAWISYSCQPKASAATGTRIENKATVVFDNSAPMDTPTVFNTIDSGVPQSQVKPLPASVPPTFTVQWEGNDDTNGSGIRGYDIYVSIDGAPNQKWLGNTTDTSSSYAGKAGHRYAFVSLATDNVGNEEAWPSQADAHTTVSGGIAATLPTGVSMVGLPLVPDQSDPAQVFAFARKRWARWDPTSGGSGSYALYGNDPGHYTWFEPADKTPGKAYWVWYDSPQDISPQGTPVDPGTPYAIPLKPGWNMVGNPFLLSVLWDVNVLQAQETGHQPLALADAPDLLDPYAWLWTPYERSRGWYTLLYEPGVIPCTEVEWPIWRGVWIHANKACDLIIPAAAQIQQVKPRQYARRGWVAQVVARAGDGVDNDNWLGEAPSRDKSVSQQAVRVAAPPPSPDTPPPVDVAFLSAAGDRFAADLRPAAEKRHVWDMSVQAAAAGDQVVLTWPDLSQVPRDISLTLLDVATGKRQYMRTTVQYAYQPKDGDGPRRFQIIAEQGGSGVLQVTSLQAQPTGNGATLVFTLSRPARTTIRVRNIAGREVALLESDELRPAGMNTKPWNGCGSQGHRLPAGMYLVELVAVDEEGQQVSAVRTLSLRR